MWTCVHCSFFNSNESVACEVCYRTDTSTSFEIVWEWTPDNQVWIPYDRPTCARLERNYHRHPTSLVKVALDQGPYFSKHPHLYRFTLDRASNDFHQTNLSTLRRRPARRRSIRDDIFVVKDKKAVRGDRCIMCQEACVYDEEEEEEEEDGEGEVVKLKACEEGHYFHRECIAGYVMMRAMCPVCFKAVQVRTEVEG
ncbi:hypothetical protein HKX48_000420 [Thoreauomyces humboldtii]|nr:hypothetical protein HKX48_000420 [Thoreauomyces humboldtii]